MFPSSRYHKNPGGSSVESAKTDKNASYQKCGLGLNWSGNSVLGVGGSGAELLHTFHLDQDLTTADIYEVGVISSANVRVMTHTLANERH